MRFSSTMSEGEEVSLSSESSSSESYKTIQKSEQKCKVGKSKKRKKKLIDLNAIFFKLLLEFLLSCQVVIQRYSILYLNRPFQNLPNLKGTFQIWVTVNGYDCKTLPESSSNCKKVWYSFAIPPKLNVRKSYHPVATMHDAGFLKRGKKSIKLMAYSLENLIMCPDSH